MVWYKQKPESTKDFNKLTETYNKKYGSFDYAKDSRSLDTTFEKVLLRSVGNLSGLNVLVCGSNSGYEIGILAKAFSSAKYTAVDIATDALLKLKNLYPYVTCIHANMEELPFNDREFDVYLNLRAIHSTDVNMEKAAAEAMRVARNKIILGVSNGYRVDDCIIKGMYDYTSQKIEQGKSKAILMFLKEIFLRNNYKVDELSSDAELFIVGQIA